MIENLDVTSWERLANEADEQYREHQAELAALRRQRAAAALAGMMTGELDATAEIDNELTALEHKLVGHSEVRRLIAAGLEAARQAEQAEIDLDRATVLKIEAQRRAELAAAVDRALSELATTLTEWLNSTETASRPERACGNLRRAFTYHFVATGFRNKPGWWRQAIVGMSEPGISLPTAVPLASQQFPAS